MRVITGGSGFLGVALARLLLEKGSEVRVFDLKRSKGLPADVEFFTGDIRGEKAVSEACAGAERVYHLAALLPQRKAPKKIMRAVHIGGARNVLSACVERGVESMVYLSSTEVYGKMEIIPCPEDGPKNPIGEYGRNKLECEALCREYFKSEGPRISILRPPTLIGPEVMDDGIITVMRLLKRGGVFPMIGGGENRVQALDVRDCARAVWMCGERKEAAGGVFNARCDDTPTLKELVAALAEHAGSRVNIINIPESVGIGVLRLLDAFGLSPMMPDHYELMTGDFISDTSKIKEMLGWRPERTYVESMRDMYDWSVRGRGIK